MGFIRKIKSLIIPRAFPNGGEPRRGLLDGAIWRWPSSSHLECSTHYFLTTEVFSSTFQQPPLTSLPLSNELCGAWICLLCIRLEIKSMKSILQLVRLVNGYRGRCTTAPVLPLIRLEILGRTGGHEKLACHFISMLVRAGFLLRVWRHEAAFWQIFHRRPCTALLQGSQLTLIDRQGESCTRWRSMLLHNRNSISLQSKFFCEAIYEIRLQPAKWRFEAYRFQC